MRKRIYFVIALLFIILIALNCNVYARITTNDPTVNSGENVTIYISSQEAVTGGAIDIASNDGLEFVSVSGGESNGTLVAFAFTEAKKSNIATYVFKAPEVTETKQFKVVFKSQDMSGEDGEIASSQATATVTVKAKESEPEPATKSNNANLKTLGVTPKEYDFTGFKKDKTEYSVTIPSNVDKLNVIAVAEEKDKAKVEISGNTGFKVGSDNKIVIKVTAEDGTTKEYTIKVTKLAEDEELPGNLLEDEDELFLTKLEIEGIDEMTPKFSKDVYFYKAILRSDIDKLVINAIANNKNAKVTITGNEDLKEGENTITIIITYDGKVEQKVYQITLVKDLSPEEADVLTIGASDENESGVERYVIVGILMIVFILLVIGTLIFLIKKEKAKLMDYDYDEEEDDDEVEEVPPLRSRKLYNQDDEDEEEIEVAPPLKSRRLYNQDNDEDYRKTIEEINAQTKSIFHKDEETDGQSVEYDDNFPKERGRRRGKH